MRLTLLSVNTADFSFYQGLVIAVSGIITVLLVLSLISACIWIASKIIYAAEHGQTKKKTIIRRVKKHTLLPEPVLSGDLDAGDEQQTEDTAIVAAITAAIAASMNTTTDRLVVRSFRRATNWQNEAIYEQRQQTVL